MHKMEEFQRNLLNVSNKSLTHTTSSLKLTGSNDDGAGQNIKPKVIMKSYNKGRGKIGGGAPFQLHDKSANLFTSVYALDYADRAKKLSSTDTPKSLLKLPSITSATLTDRE